MRVNRITRVMVLAAGLGLAACSRVPGCNDAEVLKQVTAQAQQQTSDQLAKRFKIPFLSPAAQETLVGFFGPDSLAVKEMRTASVDKDIGQRRCEATVELHYAMEGRLDKAKLALEHGAVTGQTVAYMLEGEPYLSAVRKMADVVSAPLTYTTQRTDDGKVHVEVSPGDLPLF